jgi:hypothetical protein
MTDMTYYRTLTHFAPHEAASLLYDVLPGEQDDALNDTIAELHEELTKLAITLYPRPAPECNGRVFPRVFLRTMAENRGLEPKFLNQETLYDTGLSRDEFLKAATQELLGGDWEQVYNEELVPIMNRVEPD